MPHEVLKIGDKITALPVIHGSGDFALSVRQTMLREKFDCVAVPLPPSFQHDVEQAIARLPTPSIVTQAESRTWGTPPGVPEWDPENEDPEEEWDTPGGMPHDEDEISCSYVPIDPCQPVIAALRMSLEEHIHREFIDLETAHWEPVGAVLPDAYALKKVSLERFAAAILPAVRRPLPGQFADRCTYMGRRLAELEERYDSILLICSVLEWPWIREAARGVGLRPAREIAEESEQVPDLLHDDVEETTIYGVEPQTLMFMLGELPFITALYERARIELDDDENLSIDGIKELLIASRETYLGEFKGRSRKITPHLLKTTLRYVRNLTLIERRMTPDLYNIVMGAKQVLGDQYARHVAEQANQYAPWGTPPGVPGQSSGSFSGTPGGVPHVRFGVDRARLPDGDIVRMKSRLPGPPRVWRTLELKRRPERLEKLQWQMQWNPFQQCSWPPEDELIENFRTHVMQRALQIMGEDLVRTEKFTTSVMDGIDIRDTLRNWHTGEIYVKVLPPARGTLDCVVMLFDTPADPRDYPWRTTWYAEHDEESTLAFFATDFTKEMIGPGIALATYGGAMFLFPPRQIPDIWNDEALDFADTLEDRLIAAACAWSQSRHIALLSPQPPGAGWRRLAKRQGKRLVHVPLGQFSDSTIQQLRLAHVLNGRQVRSYAAHFIRQA
jgi:hypothetical protein